MPIQTLINAVKHWALDTFATDEELEAATTDVGARIEEALVEIESLRQADEAATVTLSALDSRLSAIESTPNAEGVAF